MKINETNKNKSNNVQIWRVCNFPYHGQDKTLLLGLIESNSPGYTHSICPQCKKEMLATIKEK